MYAVFIACILAMLDILSTYRILKADLPFNQSYAKF